MRKYAVLNALAGTFFIITTSVTQESARKFTEHTKSRAPAGSIVDDAVGVPVLPDTKLVPGDEVLILVEEDREPAWRTMITDTGEASLGILGSVRVVGKTSAEAAGAIEMYLKARYYRKATVRFEILRKAVGPAPFFKASVSGTVTRPGRQVFTEDDQFTLSEAVMAAGPNIYSDLRRVSLTRDANTIEYDVEKISSQGRKDLDVRLRDGDRIYVPKRRLILEGNKREESAS